MNTPKIRVEINASRVSTRDGSHEDDEVYLTQLQLEIKRTIRDLGFEEASVKVVLDVPCEKCGGSGIAPWGRFCESCKGGSKTALEVTT